MTPTARGLLLSLCLLPSLAFAQDGFGGQYELEGRYSTRRGTAVDLKVEQSGYGFKVTRTGDYTGRRFRNVPEFTWVSSSVKVDGRKMVVTYSLDVPGSPGTSGMIDALTPDADRAEVVRALTKTNEIKAVYFLSSDKKKLTEYMVNQTRFGDQRFWLWCSTSGERKAAPSTPGLSYDDYKAIRNKFLHDWWIDDVTEHYTHELADPNLTAAERAKLEDARDTDLAADNDMWTGLDFPFEDDIYERYEYDNDPYLDAHGRAIPKSALEMVTLSMFPEYAGIGLSKAWLFDTRTGEVVDESDIMD